MLDAEIAGAVPEIIVGIILTGFAWAFRGWSKVLDTRAGAILDKLESLGKEFHEHRIEYERRATALEVTVETLERRMTRAGINGGKQKTEDK
jgi:hypothetical protein